jgi:ParB family chromosome partitioning protein
MSAIKAPTIKVLPLSQIKPYWNNPRDNAEAVDGVELSIRKYGYKQYIVVDADNVIVVGDTRYRALLRIGVQEIPVIVADDLTPAQAGEFRLIDNKSSEKAVWHWGKLETELRRLPDIADWGSLFPELELPPMDPEETPMPQVTQDQINKAHEAQTSSFANTTQEREEQIKTYTCPHCGEDFDVPS